MCSWCWNYGFWYRAQALLQGYEVIIRDIKDEFVSKGIAGIKKNLDKLVSKEK